MKSYGVFINVMPADKMRFNDIRYGLAPWMRIRDLPNDMTKREIMELLSLTGVGISVELFDDQTYHSLQLLEYKEFPENWDGDIPEFFVLINHGSLLRSATHKYGEYCIKNTNMRVA